jgi:hypothetical protein
MQFESFYRLSEYYLNKYLESRNKLLNDETKKMLIGDIRELELLLSETEAEDFRTVRSNEILEDVHRLIKSHRVEAGLYNCMGEVYSDLGIDVKDPDLKFAIEYGRSAHGAEGKKSVMMCAADVIAEHHSSSVERG